MYKEKKTHEGQAYRLSVCKHELGILTRSSRWRVCLFRQREVVMLVQDVLIYITGRADAVAAEQANHRLDLRLFDPTYGQENSLTIHEPLIRQAVSFLLTIANGNRDIQLSPFNRFIPQHHPILGSHPIKTTTNETLIFDVQSNITTVKTNETHRTRCTEVRKRVLLETERTRGNGNKTK